MVSAESSSLLGSFEFIIWLEVIAVKLLRHGEQQFGCRSVSTRVMWCNMNYLYLVFESKD